MSSDVEHLFVYLLVICKSLENYLFKSFAYLMSWVVCLSLLLCNKNKELMLKARSKANKLDFKAGTFGRALV